MADEKTLVVQADEAKTNANMPDTTMIKAKKESPIGESIYTRQELLAASYSAFGVAPEVVAGAMVLAKKTEMSRSEMDAAIKAFKERKV